MASTSSPTRVDKTITTTESYDVAIINPLAANLWELSPRPDWLQERLLAMAQMQWKDVGPIEIAHSSEPMDTWLLKRFKVGVDVFDSNDDPVLPKTATMITDFCGRWELIWRCGMDGCAECEATREWRVRRGWLRRSWDRVIRRRT